MRLSLILLVGYCDGAALCENTESASCPCSQIVWKKAKIGGKSASKIEKRGKTSVEMRIAIGNNILDKDGVNYPEAYQADWTFRHPTYGNNGGNVGVLTGSTGLVTTPKRYNPNFHIFLQWSRKLCGLDFIEAIRDGKVTFAAMDNYDVYSKQMKTYYNTWPNTKAMANKLWTSIIQFSNPNAELDGKTIPTSTGTRSVVDEGNWKKDVLYLWINGVDKVEAWKSGDMDKCLESAFIAILEIGNGVADANGDYTKCVAESMVLW